VVDISASQTRSGWTVGIGGEYAFTNFNLLSGFVEYYYYDFGTKDVTFSNGLSTVGVKETRSVVRAGLNFRFGPGPVVANLSGFPRDSGDRKDDLTRLLRQGPRHCAGAPNVFAACPNCASFVRALNATRFSLDVTASRYRDRAVPQVCRGVMVSWCRSQNLFGCKRSGCRHHHSVAECCGPDTA